jgi:hypothetical protein
MLELLIEAGYGDGTRVKRGLGWLLDTRQADGGWAIPARTATGRQAHRLATALTHPEPIPV